MHGPLPTPLVHVAIRSRHETLLAAFILLAVAIVARAQTFGNPVIGYDEQFYLLVGDRMLHGALPFVDIFDRKPIGLFLIYAGARLLGGDGFLAYKLVALAFVLVTALGVYALARRMAGQFGALAAASIFILWYNFMGGEGGQSPVFYNPFMLAGAAFVLAAIDRPGRLGLFGYGAMLSVGLAIQIKYCVLFEGVYFGWALIAIALWQGRGWRQALVLAPIWVVLALAPTALVFGVYAALGHADALFFTNFVTVFAQGRNPLATQLLDLLEIAAILAPLLIIAGVGHGKKMIPHMGAASLFLWGWLFASLFGALAFWRFNNPHYALPVLLPLAILIAPVFDAHPRRPVVTWLLLGMTMIMAQLVLSDLEQRRGGAREAMILARAAQPGPGCIYVYSSYPALYMLTNSCMLTRWIFPGTLNMKDEASPMAIGTDPAGEMARILAARPKAIVDERPVSRFGNPATRALIDRAVARDYVMAACVTLSSGRQHMVFRRRTDWTGPAATCAG